ncbi:hypothetical protein KCTC52924_00474 [Arenibacter antarcticus]|uniref:DUF1080 domain-containing protein n=1 Tax=Arenibacter antarcticus TaxID=2040469 RepID=A0ABW5VBC1_9FLAO|nr:DUF1080 domain-containing protein [Arenibacter sp. H213]MCM4169439.1 DUF1080 domain-containing protein [Arenibacter sp. H213]
MKKIIALFVFALAISSCKMNPKTDSDKTTVETTAKTESEDWIYLFDGTTTEGWRAYNGDSLPPGWVVKDSTLTFDTELGLEQDYTGGKDIIYGTEEFDNFELYVEWKLPKGGNSGIFYHLKENIPNEGPATISPEYQLIDDENYASIHDLTEYNLSLGNTENPAALQPLQQTASDYAMHAADPAKKVLHPVGEWNTTKIVFTPEKVEHWLNGQKVLSFVPWSDEWYNKKNTGKWKNAENYGRFKTGYIGFQDHSSPIWFKNVKIRKL